MPSAVCSEGFSAFAMISLEKEGLWDLGEAWASPGFMELVSSNESRVESRSVLTWTLSRMGPLSRLGAGCPR